VFVFELGHGQDVILGLSPEDTIDLSGTGLSFEELTITELGFAHYTVAYGDQGDEIDVWLNSSADDLSVDDFAF